MITRLRLDARLFDPPMRRRAGTIGRPRVIGTRQANLSDRLTNAKTRWRRVNVTGCYGRGERTLEIMSATALRHHPGRLGVETQRPWSDPAIARTTPALLGLFSLIALWAHELYRSQPTTSQATAWYPKPLPTFTDALALVRRELWTQPHFNTSATGHKLVEIPQATINALIGAACYAA